MKHRTESREGSLAGMKTGQIIEHSITDHLQIMEKVRDSLCEEIETIGTVLAAVLRKGGTLFWCGNGGSAADSQHLAAELVRRFSEHSLVVTSVATTSIREPHIIIGHVFCELIESEHAYN